MNFSTRIVDAAGDRVLPGGAMESLEESPFKRFVAAVTQHIAARTAEGKSCRPATGDSASLVFVFRPLIEAQPQPLAADLSLHGPPAFDACRLESPWASLVLRRSPARLVHARFTWNERQILLDQALMSGAQASPDQLLLPLTEEAFQRLADDYAQSVLLAASPQAAAAALAGVARRIPPDMLWLFRHAWQSTRGPFVDFARAALDDTIRLAGPGYLELVKALIDRCLASAPAGQRFASIVDLEGVVALDRYRIDRLH